MEVKIDVRRVVQVLYTIIATVILLHVAEMVLRYMLGHRRLLGLVGAFDMDEAANVPTFVGEFLLLLAAALLAVVAYAREPAGSNRRHWRWLSVIFLVLALHEHASVHEIVTLWIHEYRPMTGPFYFAWVIPYAFIVLAVGLLYLRFVLRLPPRMRLLTITSGVVYLSGALGVEMIGAAYLTAHGEEADFTYKMISGFDETLELVGAALFNYALLDYLRDGLRGEPLRVRIR